MSITMEQLIEMSPVPVEFSEDEPRSLYRMHNETGKAMILMGYKDKGDDEIGSLAHEVGHAIHLETCPDCQHIFENSDGVIDSMIMEYHAHEFAVEILGDEQLVGRYVHKNAELNGTANGSGHYRAAQKLLAWWNKKQELVTV